MFGINVSLHGYGSGSIVTKLDCLMTHVWCAAMSAAAAAAAVRGRAPLSAFGGHGQL